MARTKSNSTPSGQVSSATIGFEATAIPDFGPEHADTFRRDLHPDLRADTATRVSAKPQPRSHSAGLLRSERQLRPPFNYSDWFRKDDDVRFFSLSASTGERAGVRCRNDLPPKGNANFAWVQHFIHHLAPGGAGTAGGMAGLNAVRKDLANRSMSSNQSGDCNARSARRKWATNSQGLGSQRDIRRALIEADLVDCMVALPGQLFYSTQIPVCLWFLAKNKNADAKRGFRDRRNQTLFIDARKRGTLIDRVHRELTDADLEKITSTYHAWRSSAENVKRKTENSGLDYADIAGFCKFATAATAAEIGSSLLSMAGGLWHNGRHDT